MLTCLYIGYLFKMLGYLFKITEKIISIISGEAFTPYEEVIQPLKKNFGSEWLLLLLLGVIRSYFDLLKLNQVWTVP